VSSADAAAHLESFTQPGFANGAHAAGHHHGRARVRHRSPASRITIFPKATLSLVVGRRLGTKLFDPAAEIT
jgi:hypothetical protein